jgi:hypothetical protein
MRVLRGYMRAQHNDLLDAMSVAVRLDSGRVSFPDEALATKWGMASAKAARDMADLALESLQTELNRWDSWSGRPSGPPTEDVPDLAPRRQARVAA